MNRLEEAIGELHSSPLASFVALQQAEWQDSTLLFRAKAFAQTWKGSIEITDDMAVFNLPIPFYLAPLRGKIEGMVRQYGRDLVG